MLEHVLRLIWNRRRASWLVVVEVAAAFLVVFVVLALALDARANYVRPLGFAYQNIWLVQLRSNAFGGRSDAERERLRASVDDILAAIRGVPGVVGAHLIWQSPYTREWRRLSLGPEGAPIYTRINTLSAAALKELGVRVVEGRTFGPQDEGQEYRAVLVNRAFVEMAYGGSSPLGQRINFAPPGARGNVQDGMSPAQIHEANRELRPVGVIDDFRQDGEFSAVMPYAILLEDRMDYVTTQIFVRVAHGTDRRLEQQIAETVRSAASGFRATVVPWEELRATHHQASLLPLRIGATLAAFLLAMVALGLIGIVWQDVVRRTEELGLRRASGATARAVRSQILLEMMVICCAGIAIGILIAIQIPLLSILSQIGWTAALPALGLSALLILLLAAGAALYPALLASRREPADALRYE